ncbi:pyridoxamine 5'-phosphate oxidase family protein [Nonlabens sp. Asnod3-H03]|uniref:pyridoxamine 5'-phosphate oxidase family protein n=1 Tax=Nonlabens sp. Asnod3-H03 TaxID=3160580 RepID=UPI003865CB92
MSSENLYQREALEKYLELSRSIETSMMLTNLGSKPVDSIPMTPKRINDNGSILFFSKSTSDHNKNIQKDADTQLIFSDVKSKEFLSVYGSTSISKDPILIEELYGNLDNNWFDGKDDPTITVLTFTPEQGQYWDTKTNSIVTLAKLAYTAITGDETEIGTSGSLKL